MALSIKEKLRFLDRASASNSPKIHLQDKSSTTKPFFPESEILENEFGSCVLRKKIYPLTFAHGGITLEKFQEVPQKIFSLLGKDSHLSTLDTKKIIFLDSETTGLAGWTGTFIFLLGLGFFEPDAFVIKQFILLDVSQERAFLHEIKKCLDDKACFITYNGKSYDIPLLKTRFLIHRIATTLEHFDHIDLLHHCRRLWKKSLGICSLTNVETHLLGFQRQQDIPGSEIPSIYFNVIRTRNFDELLPIVKHNVQDILSMVSIIVASHNIIMHGSNPLTADRTWLVRLHASLKNYEAALTVPENATETPLQVAQFPLLLEKARIYKKLQRYEKAIELWTHLQSQSQLNEECYTEPAKIYEHKYNDLEKALRTIEKLEKRIEILQELRPHTCIQLKDNIKKRKNRLLRKLSRYDKVNDARQRYNSVYG